MISYKGKEYVEYDNAIALLEEKDKEIERLNNIISKAIEYIDTWGYDEYDLFRIDENNPNFTTNEDVPTIVETLKNILKGVDKE